MERQIQNGLIKYSNRALFNNEHALTEQNFYFTFVGRYSAY